MKKVIILSGGMDSVTALYHEIAEGHEMTALSFNYGSKHNEKEIPLAKWHCDKFGIKHEVVDLDLAKYFKSSLLDGGEDIPEGHYEDDNMKSTVVPFRNGIMLAFAIGYAENIEAKEVVLGSHAGDGAQYPDCRVEFTKAMSRAATEGTYNKVQIMSPFNILMKWDIVKNGIDLNVPYKKTWSCYKGNDRPCLQCGTCIERIEAFYRNNIQDPLLSDKEWITAVKNMNEVCK